MSVPHPTHDVQFYDGVPLRRLAAFVVDTAVIVVLLGGVLVLGSLIGLVTGGVGFVLLIPAFAVTGFLYRFTMLRERSATLGMMALGIELRDASGERLDGPTAAVHTLGFYATLYLPILMVLGWVVLAATPHRRLMHDLPLGTVMINRPI